jgi:hypothetical protein
MLLPNKWGNGELKLGSDSRDAKGLPGQRVLSLTLQRLIDYLISASRGASETVAHHISATFSGVRVR